MRTTKTGRPSLDADGQSAELKLRCARTEYDVLYILASRAGVSMQDVVRDCIRPLIEAAVKLPIVRAKLGRYPLELWQTRASRLQVERRYAQCNAELEEIYTAAHDAGWHFTGYAGERPRSLAKWLRSFSRGPVLGRITCSWQADTQTLHEIIPPDHAPKIPESCALMRDKGATTDVH